MPPPFCANPACASPLPPDSAACPACGSGPAVAATAATLDLDPPPGPPEPPAARFARFVVGKKLGAGAFGEVYRAYDPQLDRDVALKLARPEVLSSTARVERFRREAKAAAGLRHPNIVPVYDAGEHGGRHYLVTALVEGRTLQATAESGGSLADAAGVVRKLADALGYAHRKGVVHRDVKPANVLIDPAGEPHLLDFGLAARAGEAEQDGVALGTPRYMSPEQAAGRSGDPTPASDQYSLGVVLFELATGATPFEGDTPLALWHHHVHTPPPPPRRLRPGLSRDLEAVILRCLAKDPARRYPGCVELAEDLRRWSAGETVAARPVRWPERLYRWGRRAPRTAALVAAVFALLVAVAGVSTAAYFWVDDARWEESKAKDAAVTLAGEKSVLAEANAGLAVRERAAGERAGDSLHLSRVQLAERYRLANKAEPARQALDECDPGRRGWEWHYLARRVAADRLTFDGHSRRVTHVAVSPDGARVASAHGEEDSQGGVVLVWDAAGGREQAALTGHAGPVTGLGFLPDGRVVSAGRDGTVRVWAANQPATVLRGHTGPVTSLAVGAAGRVATGDAAGVIKLWDAAAGREVGEIRGHALAVTGLAFAPDGRLVSCGEDGGVGVWNPATGAAAERFAAGERLGGVAVAPGGRLLLTGARAAALWAPAGAGGRWEVVVRFPEAGARVALSPDGNAVASAGHDNVVRLWDAATGRPTGAGRGHTAPVTAVAWSPDGRVLASGAADRTARLWDAAALHPPALAGRGAVALSPDGRLLAARATGGGVRVWNPRTGREVAAFDAHHARAAAWVAGGLVATTDATETVRFWNPTDGRLVRSTAGPVPASLAAASRDGRHLATASRGTVVLWDADGKPTHTLRRYDGEGFVTDLAFTPDGERVAVVYEVFAAHPGRVMVHDTATGRQLGEFTSDQFTAWAAAFDPSGTRLAVGGYRTRNGRRVGTVQVWDAADGAVRLTVETGGEPVEGVAVTPDGRRLVAANGELALVDLVTGRLMLNLPGRGTRVAAGPGGLVAAAHDDGLTVLDGAPERGLLTMSDEGNAVAFTAAGRHLAVGRVEGGVAFWDLATAAVVRRSAHAAETRGVAVAADGRLASVHEDGVVQVWDAAGRDALTLGDGTGERLNAVALDRDGRRVYAAGRDEVVRGWDAHTGRLVHELRGHTDTVYALALSADGARLASAGGGGQVRVWDAATGRELAAFTTDDEAVFAAAFAPDGRLVTGGGRLRAGGAGSWEGTARVLDAATGRELLVYRGHTDRVTAVAVAPDGRRVATGGYDRTVVVWDAAAGAELVVCGRHAKEVRGLAFSPDGARLASAAADGTVRLWDAAATPAGR